MTIRITFRRLLRNCRTLIFTSLGAGLYTLGSWMQGKSAKPKRPDEPIAGQLYDMQRYLDLSFARHCLNYSILKDEAEDYRKPYPTREEYDRQVQFPSAYNVGDEINTNELSYICDQLQHDQATMVELIKHNPKLVINYLRIRYWDHWTGQNATR